VIDKKARARVFCGAEVAGAYEDDEDSAGASDDGSGGGGEGAVEDAALAAAFRRGRVGLAASVREEAALRARRFVPRAFLYGDININPNNTIMQLKFENKPRENTQKW
jgi:hypothetical protein